MSFYSSVKLIVSSIVLLIILIVLLWFYREYKINRLNKRLNKYAISVDKNQNSLFDIIVAYYISIRTKLKKILAKSNDLKKYSSKYEKYINKDSLFNKDGMDYVATKFILALVFVFILLVSTFVQNNHVSISKVIIAFSLGFFAYSFNNIHCDLVSE